MWKASQDGISADDDFFEAETNDKIRPDCFDLVAPENVTSRLSTARTTSTSRLDAVRCSSIGISNCTKTNWTILIELIATSAIIFQYLQQILKL